jgi:hypothetical protein
VNLKHFFNGKLLACIVFPHDADEELSWHCQRGVTEISIVPPQAVRDLLVHVPTLHAWNCTDGWPVSIKFSVAASRGRRSNMSQFRQTLI